MDAELKNLKRIVRFLKKEGIVSFKNKEFELTLAPLSLDPPRTKKTKHTQEAPEDKVSDLDVLFWSAPGYLPDISEAN